MLTNMKNIFYISLQPQESLKGSLYTFPLYAFALFERALVKWLSEIYSD